MKTKTFPDKVFTDLPPMLKNLTDSYDGIEKDVVLLSTIGTLSNCLPNVYGEYDRNRYFPNLYILIVAPPASGKGVMNHPRKLIEPIHQKVLGASQEARATWEKKHKGDKNKETSSVVPELVVKLMPANISSTMMYIYLKSSKDGVLIMESEADTLSNMLKFEWANFSDVLRKAFHHEPLSIDRKSEKLHLEIPEPKLSMVLSGTPSQLQPLLKSTENGLHSRFIIYSFDHIGPFKNVFEPMAKDGKDVFTTESAKILKLYEELTARTNPIQFKLTKSQQEKFMKDFGYAQNKIVSESIEKFVPNLRRYGLILFRMCMIFTVIRNIDNLNDGDEIICSDMDYMNAAKIVRFLFWNLINKPMEEESVLNIVQEKELYNKMENKFKRTDLLTAGKLLGLSTKTIDNRIKSWQERKFIAKISHYTFQKIKYPKK